MGDPLLFHCSPAGADVLINLDVPPSGAPHEQRPSKNRARARSDERRACLIGAEGDEMKECSRRPMGGPMTGRTEPDDFERKCRINMMPMEMWVWRPTFYAGDWFEYPAALHGYL